MVPKAQACFAADEARLRLEIRRPKSEIRKKAETRNPRIARSAVLVLPRSGQDFGLRPSDFFRPSDLGFGLVRHAPAPIPLGRFHCRKYFSLLLLTCLEHFRVVPASGSIEPIGGLYFRYAAPVTHLIIPIALLLWLARRWRSIQPNPAPCR
jgi:hypothetical protein